jgi:hypothetical protein
VRPRHRRLLGVRAAAVRSGSAPPRALGVRAAGRRSPCRVAGRVWAMRERIQGLVGLSRVRLAAQRASFATPGRAMELGRITSGFRTQLDPVREPPRVRLVIRGKSQEVRELRRIRRAFRGQSGHVREPRAQEASRASWLLSLIAQTRPRSRAESGARRRGRGAARRRGPRPGARRRGRRAARRRARGARGADASGRAARDAPIPGAPGEHRRPASAPTIAPVEHFPPMA